MIGLPVIIKKKNKWIVGFLNGTNITEKMEFNRLSDIKKISSYKPISKYVKKQYEKKILKKHNIEKIYVLDYPIDLTKKEFEKWWWAFYNKKCIDCKKSCKQSFKVKIIQCKGYEKIYEF
jgi:hypothetical protein